MKNIIFHTMKTIGVLGYLFCPSILATIQRHRLGIVSSTCTVQERRATIPAYDDWKSTTKRTLSVPCGLTWPSSCLTLAQVSLIVSPFFSPLSLRHGFVVVCFEVTTCELLCLLAAPCDLGDPGWGDPWFPHGAFVASLTSRYGLGFLFGLSLFFLLPYLVKMIQGYHSCINSTMNWYLSHFCLAGLSWVAAFCFGCVFLVGFVFGCLFVCFWFLLLFLFVVVAS